MTNGNGESVVQTANRQNHSLQIDRRRHTVVTGVSDVCSFQETEIVLKIDSGTMVLTGEGLHIAKLLLEEGRLSVEGHIDGVVYEQPRRGFHWAGFWKRNAK